ncbi:MAG: hypothetical protein VYD71_00290 [Bacteroidota bacterium]|nr:hypothetical protein [Bacteroidota bacterium]
MKKLIVIMLVSLVPFITMAQKRSKKDKTAKSEIKDSGLNFMVIKGLSISDLAAEDLVQEQFHIDGDRSAEKVIIKFDFGSGINNDKEAIKLMEQSRKIHSLTDAVNLLGNHGWEFVSANIERDGKFTTYYYYMKR